MPAATPPAADAISSSIPSRRLMRLSARRARRDRARRGDHGHQAGRHRDLDRQADDGIEEGHQEHTAAQAEQRAQHRRPGRRKP